MIENELLHIIITETVQVWMGIWGLDGLFKLHGRFQHSEICTLSVWEKSCLYFLLENCQAIPKRCRYTRMTPLLDCVDFLLEKWLEIPKQEKYNV